MTDRPVLADLSLFPATPEQTVESRKRSFVEWSRGQSLKEYLHKDALQEEDEHAANGKLITWVLAPRSDPTTLNFLCSCETFRRTALFARPPTPGPGKPAEAQAPVTVQEVTAYGVASVFTPSQNRGKGYARHMMRLLHWALAPPASLAGRTFPTAQWGAPPDAGMLAAAGVANACFSVLYSDVGRDFYRACGTAPGARDGWVVTGATETFWDVQVSAERGGDTDGDSGASDFYSAAAGPAVLKPNILRIGESDLGALYAHDARWIRDDLARLAMASASPAGLGSSPAPVPAPYRARTLCTFLPDAGVGLFVVRRTMEFTPALEPVMPMSTWGLALLPSAGPTTLADLLSPAPSPSPSPSTHSPSPSPPPFPFATYTLDNHALVVARLRADASTLPALLDALRAVAREEGMKRVECWGLPVALRAVAERAGWVTAPRGAHLSAIKWYGRGRVVEEHEQGPGEQGEGKQEQEQVEWVCNEKFCWC